MRTFNWTPNQIDEIPICVINGILDRMREEEKERKRQDRLAERRAKRGR